MKAALENSNFLETLGSHGDIKSLAFFELSSYVSLKPTEPQFAFKMKNKTI